MLCRLLHEMDKPQDDLLNNRFAAKKMIRSYFCTARISV